MDRLAVGIIIALAVLLMNGGFVRGVSAAEAISKPHVQSLALKGAAGQPIEGRAGRVLTLIVALSALNGGLPPESEASRFAL